MKILKICFLCFGLTLLECCRFEPSFANVEDIKKLRVGMTELEVREIMTLEPIEIEDKDSVWIGEWVYPAKTLVYDTPFMASSLISISFTNEDSLFVIYYDR
jgi:hypothetical protein